MKTLSLMLIFFIPHIFAFGQVEYNKKLAVFIDCSNVACDFNFIRSEIPIVDYLNDQVAADVHVLITAVQNGNGGKNYNLTFYGQKMYDKDKVTYTFNTEPNATDAENRVQLVRTIKIGLLHFLARTPFAKYINVDMNIKEKEKEQAVKERDFLEACLSLLFPQSPPGDASKDL
jgi:hypothetical protein